MTVGIIQPGRLGDIIICAPIAKYYTDKGHKVYWPVFEKFVPMLSKAFTYVEFIPVTDNVYECAREAYYHVGHCNKIIDIAATFPGSLCTERYVKEGDGWGPEKFDEFKYKLAEVPFYRKWVLEYERNLVAEDELYNLYVKQEKYDVFSLKHSRGKLDKKIESKNQLIEINEKHSLFDWRKILEGAQNIVLVDSAMANFVEQLNLPNKKILLMKQGHPGPTFRGDWKIIPA